MLIKLLILFFILLIFYQIFLAIFGKKIMEGLENENEKENEKSYQDYNTTDPKNVMILTQQNSGNIEYLKGQISQLTGLKEEVADIKHNVALLNDQLNEIGQQQAVAATQLAGSTPVTVTGT